MNYDFVDIYCGDNPRLPKPLCLLCLEFAVREGTQILVLYYLSVEQNDSLVHVSTSSSYKGSCEDQGPSIPDSNLLLFLIMET